MPVTARLSQRFYEKLGEDIANELVERFNDLWESFRTRWTRLIGRICVS
jgi:hypothetical protein